MATDKPKVLLILDDDLLKRIDDYRYENRIPARTEAIRRLIDKSLSQYEKKKKVPRVNDPPEYAAWWGMGERFQNCLTDIQKY
jgi:hypothetical protein